MITTLKSSIKKTTLKIYEDKAMFQLASLLDPRFNMDWCPPQQVMFITSLLKSKEHEIMSTATEEKGSLQENKEFLIKASACRDPDWYVWLLTVLAVGVTLMFVGEGAFPLAHEHHEQPRTPMAPLVPAAWSVPSKPTPCTTSTDEGTNIQPSHNDPAPALLASSLMHKTGAPLITTRFNKKKKQQSLDAHETLGEKTNTKKRKETKHHSKTRSLENLQDRTGHKKTNTQGVTEPKMQRKANNLKTKTQMRTEYLFTIMDPNKKRKKQDTEDDEQQSKKNKKDTGDREEQYKKTKKDTEDHEKQGRKRKGTEDHRNQDKKRKKDTKDHEKQDKKTKDREDHENQDKKTKGEARKERRKGWNMECCKRIKDCIKKRNKQNNEDYEEQAKKRSTEKRESQAKKRKGKSIEDHDSQAKKRKRQDNEDHDTQAKKKKMQDREEHDSHAKKRKRQDKEDHDTQAKKWKKQKKGGT
ncbi:uncharacterized protein LOC135092297 [Scylla paramamosain]|uniref:uncharacterized protein LOC135092297 n=1 Tax=Scylla paramamosain TaxID=85552 RepID=UPI00308308E2